METETYLVMRGNFEEIKKVALYRKQEKKVELWYDTRGPGEAQDHMELAVTDPDWIRRTLKL